MHSGTGFLDLLLRNLCCFTPRGGRHLPMHTKTSMTGNRVWMKGNLRILPLFRFAALPFSTLAKLPCKAM